MAPANELAAFKETVLKEFGRCVAIIEPVCREGTASLTNSVRKQVDQVFNEHLMGITDNPLFIIGYSQGGVVACHLAQLYGDNLNIKGVITINSPLKGIPVLERGIIDVRYRFMPQAAAGLELVTQGTETSVSSIKQNMTLATLGLSFLRKLPLPYTRGLKDIRATSNVVQEVGDFLRENIHKTPFLLLGSYHNDFEELFNRRRGHHKVAIENLSNAYAKFVTGKEKNNLHDTLIPAASQLGRGDSFDDLTLITDEEHRDFSDPITMQMEGQPYIERKLYKGETHAGNLIVLDDALFIDDSIERVLVSDRIINEAMGFMRKNI